MGTGPVPRLHDGRHRSSGSRWNTLAPAGLRFDPYPFIFLTLILSLQASYAAPLILLAQNRQADRDRVALEEDRRRAATQKADTEYLAREIAALRIALGEVATRDFLRSELAAGWAPEELPTRPPAERAARPTARPARAARSTSAAQARPRPRRSSPAEHGERSSRRARQLVERAERSRAPMPAQVGRGGLAEPPTRRR